MQVLVEENTWYNYLQLCSEPKKQRATVITVATVDVLTS